MTDSHSSAALLSALEALLFVSGEPLSVTHLAKALTVSEDAVRAAASELFKNYEGDETRGLMLIQDDRTLLLATKPKNAPLVESLTKSTLQEGLSKAAAEVLAIIAYRSPIARAEIDAIRGVNSSFTLRALLLRDLIAREGNPSESRGYLYRLTPHFLQVLGIGDVSALPDYETLSRDERLTQVLGQEPEDLATMDSSQLNHLKTT